MSGVNNRKFVIDFRSSQVRQAHSCVRQIVVKNALIRSSPQDAFDYLRSRIVGSGRPFPRARVSTFDVQIELEFRSVGFCGGRKTGDPGEKPSEQGKNQQQTRPT